jgi:hypothetical protein
MTPTPEMIEAAAKALQSSFNKIFERLDDEDMAWNDLTIEEQNAWLELDQQVWIDLAKDVLTAALAAMPTP